MDIAKRQDGADKMVVVANERFLVLARRHVLVVVPMRSASRGSSVEDVVEHVNCQYEKVHLQRVSLLESPLNDMLSPGQLNHSAVWKRKMSLELLLANQSILLEILSV